MPEGPVDARVRASVREAGVDAFRAGMVVSALLMFGGGLLAAIGIQNPRRAERGRRRGAAWPPRPRGCLSFPPDERALHPTAERFTLTPERYALVARVALWTLTLIVLTGAAVRVTGSGLGCPTWPKCTDESLYTELNTHGVIEFGNRLLTSVVGFACLAAFVGAFRRRPRRRDLVLLGALLPLGVLAQIVLGGFTVRYDLAPGFVMSHYLLSMLIIVAAVALDRRAHRPDGEPPARERPARGARHVAARPGRRDHDLRRHGGERGRPARRRRRDRRRHQAVDVQGRRHAALRHRAARPPGDAARRAGGRAVGARSPSRRDARAAPAADLGLRHARGAGRHRRACSTSSSCRPRSSGCT